MGKGRQWEVLRPLWRDNRMVGVSGSIEHRVCKIERHQLDSTHDVNTSRHRAHYVRWIRQVPPAHGDVTCSIRTRRLCEILQTSIVTRTHICAAAQHHRLFATSTTHATARGYCECAKRKSCSEPSKALADVYWKAETADGWTAGSVTCVMPWFIRRPGSRHNQPCHNGKVKTELL